MSKAFEKWWKSTGGTGPGAPYHIAKTAWDAGAADMREQLYRLVNVSTTNHRLARIVRYYDGDALPRKTKP